MYEKAVAYFERAAQIQPQARCYPYPYPYP
jgi:hypothetical protein